MNMYTCEHACVCVCVCPLRILRASERAQTLVSLGKRNKLVQSTLPASTVVTLFILISLITRTTPHHPNHLTSSSVMCVCISVMCVCGHSRDVCGPHTHEESEASQNERKKERKERT